MKYTLRCTIPLDPDGLARFKVMDNVELIRIPGRSIERHVTS